MFDLINNIWQSITGIIQFITSSLSAIWAIITHIPNYVTFITSSINVLPAAFIPFIIATVSVYVVFMILGR